jgi:cytochrome c oxidase subunit IV
MTATTETTGAHGGVHAHAASRPQAQAQAHAEHQQHPIKIYLVVWVLLFALSTASYLVDYFDLHGAVRWTLILLFMWLKAGFIVAIFMHMAWERLALIFAILSPPLALVVFLGMMAFEGDYTNGDRHAHFAAPVVEAGSQAAPD